ncbi:type II secretion system minor pseudopilin GspI [Alteromonadaceae bacterium BrNp21-10]|nr:type II secretion system minor pseudopilin GspI [Alteromonadaceae bacterium BrNp21-10]
MKQRGMTLLEVMVALIIFAVTGTAIMKSATEHLSGINMIEELTFATWVANNRLADVHLEQKWPLKNNLKGSQDMAGRTWYWQQTVIETLDEDLRMVEVRVGLNEDGTSSVTSVQTYIAKPQVVKKT